jgi:hypothetical protein
MWRMGQRNEEYCWCMDGWFLLLREVLALWVATRARQRLEEKIKVYTVYLYLNLQPEEGWG